MPVKRLKTLLHVISIKPITGLYKLSGITVMSAYTCICLLDACNMPVREKSFSVFTLKISPPPPPPPKNNPVSSHVYYIYIVHTMYMYMDIVLTKNNYEHATSNHLPNICWLYLPKVSKLV